jgi:uncharacterized protein (TIGR03083 family)
MKLSPRYDGPPILTFDGPADDQLAPVTRQRRRMEAMLAALADDEWGAPTRCDGWTIQDVISHLVTVNSFWETSVTAGLGGEPTRYLATFDPAAHPPLMVDGMRALSPHEVFDQFVSTNDGFLGAIGLLDESGWSTFAESPAGHVSIRLLAHHALWDAWVHERDIALPLGLTPPVEPDEVRSSLRYAAALGPALALSQGVSIAGEFAVVARDPDARFVVAVDESVSVRDGATATDAPCLRGGGAELVEALSIRAPLPVGTPAEWYDVLNGLASTFDAELETR